ncbi:MAG: hypothetical protein WAP03_06170 [Methylorubrum rhodinum]|uniref:hypothetical protein n=1 Tax=Methylorubrum rhodinum TaxID=29428 RepID=UPI003BB21242
MSPSFGVFFGGLIAVVLLILFASTTGYMVVMVVGQCAAIGNCPPASPDFGKGLIYVVTTVGGLVSALVIAQLSVIQPGAQARLGNFLPTSTAGIYTTNTVVALYLLVWIATGLSALVVGVMFYPDRSSTLSDIGTTWLGLAVSAAYAYFGIKPEAKAEREPEATRDAAASTVVTELKAEIDANRIVFDPGKADQLTMELLGTGSGTKATAKLQALVLALVKVKSPLRISSIIRPGGHHEVGRAVDIGNEDIASALLPTIATNAKVAALKIDEIIFDATTAGQADANIWNYDGGSKHTYDAVTLADHKDHIHFAVTA